MKPTGKLSLPRFCLLLLMFVSYTDTFVLSAPKGGHVVSGQATFQQDGNLTVITAGNRSIINYGSFNIAAGETVRFVQPGANSSVLNRVVGSANPTEIFGSLQANGHVFLVNPYGIYFRNGSVLNVGSLYAGAGNLSDASFSKGKIHFTDLAGDVRNDGVIAADNRIALLGANVVNTGSLRANTGLVTMVSGTDVYVGERNGNIFVQANGRAAARAATATAGGHTSSSASGSVVNTGTVSAPRILLGGGDLYSTAISNSGLLQGRKIAVNAGQNGTATVGGTLDASGATNRTADGQGGTIQVLGGHVALRGATVDASGPRGGGAVRVGGDFHGAGPLARSATTVVDAATTVRADATGPTGDGGTVVLWSDAATSDSGAISARGGAAGGDGGAVEVSSRGGLGFHGPVDTAAPAGRVGTLLLDPTNIRIVADAATDDAFVAAPTLTANTADDPATLTVSQGSLQAATAAITLTASHDIRVDPLTGGVLTLKGTAPATFTAGANLADGTASTGSFVMADETNTIVNPGQNLTIRANGASVSGGINGGGDAIAVGNLSTASATGNGGAVTLDISGATNASVRVGSIVTSSASGNAGNITVGNSLLSGNVVTGQGGNTGALTARGTGTGGAGGVVGTGGLIKLDTSGNVNLNGPVSVSSDGGSAGTIQIGAAAAPASLAATSQITAQATGTTADRIGNGGAVTLHSAGTITLDAAVNASSASAAGGAIRVTGGNGNVRTGNLNVNSASSAAGAGSVVVNTTGIVEVNNVTAASAAGPGGAITLGNAATTTLNTTGGGGALTATGTTGGGAVTLTAAGPITVNGAINASTTGTGTGGPVSLTTSVAAPVSTLGITSTSAGGAGGSVTVGPVGATLPNNLNVGVIDTSGSAANNGGPVTLLTTGNLGLATGSVTLTGDTVLQANTVNAFEFTTQGYNFSLTLTGQAINLTSILDTPRNLTLGGALVNLNKAAQTTTGSQTYDAPTLLLKDVALTSGGNGDIRFNGTLGGAFALTLNPNGAGLAVFNGVVGGIPLTSLTVQGGTSILGGGSVSTFGAQNYFGSLNLGVPTALNSAVSSVAVTNTLTGNGNDLTVGAVSTNFNAINDAGGNLTFNLAGTGVARFGGAVNAASLKRTGTGVTSLFGNVTTNGLAAGQSYGGAVTINNTLTLADNASGPIFITGATNGVTNGGQGLTVNTAGVATFGGAVGGTVAGLTRLASLTASNAAGSVQLNSGTVVTTGAQTYNGTLTLGANTVLTSTATGNVGLHGLTGGNSTLSINTAGTTSLAGTATGLASLTTDAPGTTSLGADLTTTGAQTYNDTVTLAADTILRAGSGEIKFIRTLDGSGVGGQSLTLFTTGKQTFTLAVGTTLNAAALGSLTTGTGEVDVNGGAVRTSGVQVYNGPLTLGANLTLTTTNPGADAGAITFNSTIAGLNRTLATSTQGGNTVFGADGASVGGALLGSLTTSASGSTVFNDAAFTTAGPQNYQGAVVVQGAGRALSLLATAGNIDFGKALTSPSALSTDLTVTATGAGSSINFRGSVGSLTVAPDPAAALNSLTVSVPVAVGSFINLNGGLVNTASDNPRFPAPDARDGAQSYTGAVRLGLDTTLAGSTITSTGAINAQFHVLTLTLSNLVQIPLAGFNNVTNFTSNGPGGTQITGGFTTTGFQHYDNPTTVAANLTLSAGAGGFEFGTSANRSTLDGKGGPFSLTLTTVGPVTFNGPVGGGTPLASLTVSPGASKVFLNGTTFTTDKDQNYGGPVVLGAPAGLTTLTSNTGGKIDLTSTLDGAAVGQTLNVNTGGSLFLRGAVGGSLPLARLAAGGIGTTFVNGGVVTTAGGGQSYAGPVSFGSALATTLKDTAAGNLDFNSTVNNLVGPLATLGLNTGGSITFTGAVGTLVPLSNTGPLGTLTATAGNQIFVNGGLVNSTGFQNYTATNGLTLGQSTTFAAATGALTFNASIDGLNDGAQALTLNTSGVGAFNGLVGRTHALASLTTDAGGSTRFNVPIGGAAQGVNVTGDVAINDAVLFAATGSTLTAPTVRSGGAQAYNAGGSASQDTALVGGATLTVGNTLDFNAHDLGLRFGGDVTLPGNVVGVRNFLADGAGRTLLNGAFNTSGTQFYDNAVLLGGPSVLASTGGTVTFNRTVDGAASLSVTVAGAASRVLFKGLVGDATPLLGLTTNSPGGTIFSMNAASAATLGHGGVTLGLGGLTVTGPVSFGVTGSTLASADHPSIFSTGAQTYNGAATLSADTALLAANGSAITFASTVDAAADAGAALSVSTAGNEGFGDLVGGKFTLSGLSTDTVATVGGVSAVGGEARFAGTLGAAQAGVRVDGGVSLNDASRFDFVGSALGSPAVLTRANGTQTYVGPVTLVGQTVFTSTADLPTGPVFQDGGQITFGGNVASAAGRQNFYVRTGVGQTQILGSLDPASLDLGGALAIFQGNVGPVGIFSVQPNNGRGGSVSVIGGNITTTTGGQLYSDAVLLSADAVLTAPGDIVFNGSVNNVSLSNPHALTLNTGGLTVFNGPVGNTAPLLSLTTDNQGNPGEGTQFNIDLTQFSSATAGVRLVNGLTINDPVTFNVTAGSLTRSTVVTGVSGGVGFQTYASAATLRQTTVLTDLGVGNITFGGTLNGPFDLFINTGGDEVFNGLVGDSAPLLSLETDAAGPVSGAVRFNMDLSPAAANGTGVDVAGSVNIRDNVVFNAANNAGSRFTIRTGGAQDYRGLGVVAQDTILASTGNGGIRFFGNLDNLPGLAPLLAIPRALTINTGGATTFGAPVGSAQPLGSLTTDAAGSTALNGGSVATVGAQTFNDVVTLGADTTLSGGSVRFVLTLDSDAAATPRNLSVLSPGTTEFDGVVGGGAALGSLLTDAGGATRLRGGAVFTVRSVDGSLTGNQTFNDAVTLGLDTVLTSGPFGAAARGGNVTFAGTLDSDAPATPRALSVNTGALTVFNGPVGNAAPLASLTTDDQGQPGEATRFSVDLTQFSTATAGVRVVGGVTVNDAVLFSVTGSTAARPSILTGVSGGAGGQTYVRAAVLQQDTVLADASAGNLVFRPGATVDGPFNLTLNTGGLTAFNAAVGASNPLASLTTDGPGRTRLNARQVVTVGDQSYGDSVTLLGNHVLTSNNLGRIDFDGTLDGGFSLLVQTGGQTRFGGSVGGGSPLASLTTDRPGFTSLDGGAVTTVGDQLYNDRVILGLNNVLASLGLGNLRFARALDSAAAAAPRNLSLLTGGVTEFDGAVGGNVDANGSLLALGGLTTDAGGATRLLGGAVNTVRTATASGAQTYGDFLTLGADTVLASRVAGGAAAGGDVTFRSTVDGAFALTINTTGLTRFNGLVGSGSPLAALATDADPAVGVGGETRFSLAVGAARAGVLVNGLVTINDAVLFNVVGASLAQPSVLTLADANQVYNGPVTLGSSTFLTGATALPGAVGDPFAGGGAVRFGSPAGISAAGGSDLFVRGGVGTTRFNAAINVGSLELGGSRALFNGPVNLPGLLSVVPNDGGPGGSVELAGGGLTTAGAQTFAVGLLLGADTALTSLNTAGDGGRITFRGTVDSDSSSTPRALVVNTGGDEVFGGLVGSRAALGSLTTDAPGPVGGTARFNLDLTGTAPGTAGVNVLGAVTINDAVRFHVSGVSLADASHPAILSGGAQTYNGAATLAADTALLSRAGSALVFNAAVDGAFGLALSGGGDEIFNGLVGRGAALASLTTDVTGPVAGQARFNMDTAGSGPSVNVSGAVTINDGVVFNAAHVALGTADRPTVGTGGAQTYNGPAFLAQNTVLTSAADAVRFNNTLDGVTDGAFGLATNSGTLHVFNGVIGGSGSLASLTTNGGETDFNVSLVGSAASAGVRVSGPLTVNGAVRFNVAGSRAAQPTVLTVGAAAQAYRGPVTLLQGTVLAGGGDLLLAGTVDGPFDLALNAAGLTTLGGAVGGVRPLASLTTDGLGSTLLDAGAVTTGGPQAYGDRVVLARGAVLVSNGGGALIFRSDVNGAANLVLNSTGNETFNGRVGGVTPLASLRVDADPALRGGTTVFNVGGGTDAAPTVLTRGEQTYYSGLTLLAATVLTTNGGGTVTAASVAGGGFDLNVNAAASVFGTIGGGGNLRFNVVGGVAAFGGPVAGASLDVAGGTNFNGAGPGVQTVQTTGDQNYRGVVTLGLDANLAAGGAVNFASLDGGGHSLTLSASSAVLGRVDDADDLLWTVNGSTTLAGDITARSLTLGGIGNTVALDGDGTSLRVTTTGDQLFSGRLSLGADTFLRASGTAANGRSSAVTLGALTGNRHDLTVDAGRAVLARIDDRGGNLLFRVPGTTTLNGRVLADTLNVTGGTALNGGVDGGDTVRTDGAQVYAGNVTLGAAAVLTSLNDAVRSGGTFSGSGHDLTVNAANATFGRIDGTGDTVFTVRAVTRFDAAVGAGSLTVGGGGRLELNAGQVTTDRFQNYAGDVTLVRATALTSQGRGDPAGGGNDVTFGGRLGGAQTLAVNTSGDTVFNGTVGEDDALAGLTIATGVARVNGGLVNTTGAQTYLGAVVTATGAGGQTRLFANGSDLVFRGPVTGAGGSLLVRGHRLLLGDDVTVNGGSLTLDAAQNPDDADTALLLLDGRNYVSNGGSVTLNGSALSVQSDRSNVVFTNPGTVNVRGSGFTVGSLQKIFAVGTLNIDVGRGVAVVGDIAAGQSLRVNAREIDLLNRPAGLGAGQRPNTGLNFVAGQSINFGQANLVYRSAANPNASFITLNGNVTLLRRDGISIFSDPNVEAQFRDAFTRSAAGGFLALNPFQPVGGGSQTLDTAAALSGALPDQKPLDFPVDVTITAGQMEELRKLGIHPRKAQDSERGGATSRKALFAQLVDGEDAENYGRLQPVKGGISRLVPSDYVVVVDRMSEREVQAILLAFETLYGKDKAKAPEIGAAYQKAFDEYTVEKQTNDPTGFGPYLKAKGGQYPAVDTAARGFDNLFGYIEHMGLTPVEVTKAEGHIVSDLNVSGPTPEDMVKVINEQRQALPPAKKAPSTRVPPAPPVSAPGPSVSPAPAASPAPATSPEPIPELKPLRADREPAPASWRADLAGL